MPPDGDPLARSAPVWFDSKESMTTALEEDEVGDDAAVAAAAAAFDAAAPF